MNTILLEPNDVLFFRDGRPMTGASSGQGAAWPHPSVINNAFHAALHRAELKDVHGHKHIIEEQQRKEDLERVRKFGSLVTAGPFPVNHCRKTGSPRWYFPRPADAVIRQQQCQTLLAPVRNTPGSSSVQQPCQFPTVSALPPSKDELGKWWSATAWQHYLDGDTSALNSAIDSIEDSTFSSSEHNYGIGINSESGTVEDGQFYSAHYLRLQANWKLGVFASAMDKKQSNPEQRHDLVKQLFTSDQHHNQIVTGGQQRICSADVITSDAIALPQGKRYGFNTQADKHLVKWVLLSPAIWPKMQSGKTSKRKNGTTVVGHCGGWLPNWIDQQSGKVLLQLVSKEERKRRRKQNYRGEGYQSQSDIDARLVSAIVPKAIPITGYALAHSSAGRDTGGAKPTQLAVPAGAVYYFEADSAEAATKLADALNWHGNGDMTTIKNRRSTLLGEKGFGIGVCGSWQYQS